MRCDAMPRSPISKFELPLHKRPLTSSFSLSLPDCPSYPLQIWLWVETPAQHFPFSRNGYFDLNMTSKYSACQPIPDLNVAYAMDWRNRIAEAILGPLGIPIIPLWNHSAPLWDTHVVTSVFWFIRHSDCTHYCLPGVPSNWPKVLLHVLQTYFGVGTPPSPHLAMPERSKLSGQGVSSRLGQLWSSYMQCRSHQSPKQCARQGLQWTHTVMGPNNRKCVNEDMV